MGEERQDFPYLGLILQLVLLIEQLLHAALDCPGDLVHVLRLDDGLQVVLQDLGEVVLQLGSPEVGQDLGPVRWTPVVAQVGLLLAGEDLESRGLADTVGAHETEDLTGPWNGKSVELEGIRGVAVGGGLLQVTGQVDDSDRLEGAFLNTDTTTDTEALRDGGDLVSGRHLDTQLAHPHHGARLLALLTASEGWG